MPRSRSGRIQLNSARCWEREWSARRASRRFAWHDGSLLLDRRLRRGGTGRRRALDRRGATGGRRVLVRRGPAAAGFLKVFLGDDSAGELVPLVSRQLAAVAERL